MDSLADAFSLCIFMTSPPTSLSSELLAANQRLHQLRKQLQANKPEPTHPSEPFPWEEAVSPVQTPTAVDQVTKIPNHLGWDSDVVTQAIRKSLPRESRVEHFTADHPSFHPTSDGSYLDGQPSDSQSRAAADKKLPLPIDKSTIKHYPTIGIAALKEEKATIYRVWLVCRYLDRDGRGWLSVQDGRERLTDTDSQLRLFTWRRLRQVLTQGHGRFWIWDKEYERLWLLGAA